jgi:hypothetical protein
MAELLALSRRELLRYGVLQIGGIGLPSSRRGTASGPRPAQAKSCILLYMDGAPSHIDIWDMKPDAPAEFRGPFRPIATTLPGVTICEHFPKLARQMHRLALIRSVCHDETVHPPALYYVLTGYKKPNTSGNPEGRLLHHPNIAAVVNKLDPARGAVSRAVELPETMAIVGSPMDGQDAGFLGPAFDPLRVKIALESIEITRPELSLPVGVSQERLGRRADLLDTITNRESIARQQLNTFQWQALAILADGGLNAAFDLDREPNALRDRYGRHRHGQSVLLARRLVQAGVHFVAVNWGREPQDWADGVPPRVAPNPWDTHRNQFPLLKDTLMPRADGAFATLIEDLHDRGMLGETLVVWMGEFGRSPRISKFASRDHWPAAYSVVMAGGGVRGGSVIGRTDATASAVVEQPVSPPDILATIYQALGIDPKTMIRDRLGRPYPISTGSPIAGLFT